MAQNTQRNIKRKNVKHENVNHNTQRMTSHNQNIDKFFIRRLTPVTYGRNVIYAKYDAVVREAFHWLKTRFNRCLPIKSSETNHSTNEWRAPTTRHRQTHTLGVYK